MEEAAATECPMLPPVPLETSRTCHEAEDIEVVGVRRSCLELAEAPCGAVRPNCRYWSASIRRLPVLGAHRPTGGPPVGKIHLPGMLTVLSQSGWNEVSYLVFTGPSMGTVSHSSQPGLVSRACSCKAAQFGEGRVPGVTFHGNTW